MEEFIISLVCFWIPLIGILWIVNGVKNSFTFDLVDLHHGFNMYELKVEFTRGETELGDECYEVYIPRFDVGFCLYGKEKDVYEESRSFLEYYLNTPTKSYNIL
jgi:hypothetical protein